jgi:hypothetical protein
MVRVSVVSAKTDPLPEADDLSVSSSREENNDAKGMACRFGPVVWRLVWVINV